MMVRILGGGREGSVKQAFVDPEVENMSMGKKKVGKEFLFSALCVCRYLNAMGGRSAVDFGKLNDGTWGVEKESGMGSW